MGSYAYLRLEDLVLTSTKREVDPTVLMLFTEQDKRVWELTPTEVADIMGDSEGEYEPILIGEYRANLAVVRDRLDFMGFTLPIVKQAFIEGVDEEVLTATQRKESASFKLDSLQKMSDREIELLRCLSFEAWTVAASQIVREKIQPDRKYWGIDETPNGDISAIVKYLLGNSFGEGIWFPGHDLRLLMRALVEIAGTDLEVVYDLTELALGEELDVLEDHCAWARWQLADELLLTQKIVVLTEGNTDKLAIEGALHLLYPHLAEYYSFMDFEGTRVPGGAGILVNTLKAFIGAGIANRIIALFDNDTAARSAVRALRTIQIPDNVRVLHYPNAEWAESYPTLGPQCLSEMDVNGLAGSIEMYYGLDVLRRQSGNLVPVQWRGYEDGLRQYQGELMEKAELQRLFADKLQTCKQNSQSIAQYDWAGMLAILESLRTAFHITDTTE